jgi:RNA polymerase sigma-70 factor (ECF subfamily)
MNGQTMVDSFPGRVVKEPSTRIATLFDAHYERLYRLARRLTANADDALDLVQETFLRAAGASFIPHGPTAEEAWLVRVLVNLRRDEWRRAATRRHLEPKADLLALPVSDPQSPLFLASAPSRSAGTCRKGAARSLASSHRREEPHDDHQGTIGRRGSPPS